MGIQNAGLSIVIARAAVPKQSRESKERLLCFARNDNGDNRKALGCRMRVFWWLRHQRPLVNGLPE